ncbi:MULTISPECIES: GNAT family N-acetyltransferase [Bacillus cereus group]|uniref:GNAT family N-acetyltransferase n=1 Tax=Bacillus cereus TaxID=1396 RepID=A0AA44TF07_BACCE|nr:MULTISPECIES: GNAT family N-acetyltransferase [Bacillus cereus group]EEL50854.1 Acetyltransferase [Bacillus cereus Rock3-44]PFA23010.1 GNAT family N-acetyltransferase [Bacillus cereus]PFN04327.1 GNAT family N-acetyltransferase [Bacillus cereus]PFO80625.1 GNAT family N-acetyltransferase [Bacillus cereus]PFR21009.1 GNAT family N-acetyltransferase [Bacillus cereus]
MITFEKVNTETKKVVEEMFASHGLNKKEVQYCIKVDDTYIGVIDYIVQGEHAILSNLIIHFDYQGYGYGTNTYFTLEEMMKHRNIKDIQVLQGDVTEQAKPFIEGLGFILNGEMYIKSF